MKPNNLHQILYVSLGHKIHDDLDCELKKQMNFGIYITCNSNMFAPMHTKTSWYLWDKLTLGSEKDLKSET